MLKIKMSCKESIDDLSTSNSTSNEERRNCYTTNDATKLESDEEAYNLAEEVTVSKLKALTIDLSYLLYLKTKI